MRLSTKVAYNTIIQLASKFIATLFGLFTVALIARSLGLFGFGEYTTIITFLSFFGIIADFGLTLVTSQMISQSGVDQNKIINNLFSLRLVSALIFLCVAPIAVLFFNYNSEVKLGVLVAASSFFFIALNQVFVGLFQKELRLDKVSIAEVIGRIILFFGTWLALKAGLGLMAILTVTVLANAISFLFHFIFALKFINFRWEIDLDIWKGIIKKSWPLGITIFFNLIYLKADTLILSLIKDQSEVGIYGAAYKVVDVFAIIPFMFAGIALPIITASWAEKNMQKFQDVFQKSFNFMIILAVPLLFGTQFVAGEVMRLVAGEEFIVSGQVLKILIGAAVLVFLTSIPAHAIIAMDQQKKTIPVYIFTAITSLLAYLYFIPKYSYTGAAWVTIYSEASIMLASIYFVYKSSKYFPSLKIFINSIGASIIMSLFLFITAKYGQNNYYLILKLSLATLVYFLFLYIFKGITKEDFKKFKF